METLTGAASVTNGETNRTSSSHGFLVFTPSAASLPAEYVTAHHHTDVHVCDSCLTAERRLCSLSYAWGLLWIVYSAELATGRSGCHVEVINCWDVDNSSYSKQEWLYKPFIHEMLKLHVLCGEQGTIVTCIDTDGHGHKHTMPTLTAHKLLYGCLSSRAPNLPYSPNHMTYAFRHVVYIFINLGGFLLCYD